MHHCTTVFVKRQDFLCSGDFDGNGSHDIAMINDVGVVGIWDVNDGCLSSWSILSAVTSEWQFAGVGDFNADGTDDIAWCNNSTGLAGCRQINDKQLTAWANIAPSLDSDIVSERCRTLPQWRACPPGCWQINDKQLTAWTNPATFS